MELFTMYLTTIPLYLLIFYMSYVSAAILHVSWFYRLLEPTAKAFAFIMLCYIIIIADICLYYNGMYASIAFKNGFLLLLISTSLVTARAGRETNYAHKRE